METPESEYSGGSYAVEKSTPRVCCSCGKRSLCKTSKCKCLAAFGSCGTGCGCSPSRCTNRGVSSIKMDDSLQQEVAQETMQSSGTSETERGIVVSQPADLDSDNVPRRKPLSEIGNTVMCSILTFLLILVSFSFFFSCLLICLLFLFPFFCSPRKLANRNLNLSR